MQITELIVGNKKVKKLVEWSVAGLVMVWCALLTISKINLTTADLGRHIENGSTIMHGTWAEKLAVLHTNFYSYTNASFPFVNHHWGSGVLFYGLFRLGGFPLLSLFYVAVTVATFFIFFRMAQKSVGSVIAVLIAVLVLPIVSSRREVRPEAFTYLMCGIFYWALWNLHQDRLSQSVRRWVYCLPVLMLLWVNLHIGFIVGIGIIGVFWLWEGIVFLKKQENNFRFLSIILATTVGAALINPFGLQGLLYPLNIFRNYGYTIVENQSIFFLQRLHFGSGMYFGFFETLVVLVFVSFLGVFIFRREKFSGINFLLYLTFAGLATLAIRDFPLFGLFALPITAQSIAAMQPRYMHLAYRIAVAVAALSITASVVIKISGDYQNGAWQTFGFGLMPGVMNSANFYRQNNITGPIFNNYDNGGYLIFALGEDVSSKVFVDNRPEAYPTEFFQGQYIPAQNDPSKFEQLDKQYHFNVIYFNYNDATPWGQAFLVRIVHDPAWAPVFVDNYNIILLKRNAKNAALIKKYELPAAMFGTR